MSTSVAACFNAPEALPEMPRRIAKIAKGGARIVRRSERVIADGFATFRGQRKRRLASEERKHDFREALPTELTCRDFNRGLMKLHGGDAYGLNPVDF